MVGCKVLSVPERLQVMIRRNAYRGVALQRIDPTQETPESYLKEVSELFSVLTGPDLRINLVGAKGG